MERRELTPEERLLVYKNRRNAIPKVVKSLADSPAEDLASPVWHGLYSAAAGAGLGGAVGYTAAFDPSRRGRNARIGALIGAGILGALGAFSRHAENQAIVDTMKLLPPGSRRMDMLDLPENRRWGNFGDYTIRPAPTKSAARQDVRKGSAERVAQQPRRERFTPEEERMIQREQSKTFAPWSIGFDESLARKLYNPGPYAALSAVLGAPGGGVLGYGLGLLENRFGRGRVDPGAAAILGAALGALALGSMGWKERVARNNDIIETLRRLPPGSTIRDVENDTWYPSWNSGALTSQYPVLV